jgi:hypothetical protein
MTKSKLTSVVLIAAAMLATPAMARESGQSNGMASRHVADDSGKRMTPQVRYIDGQVCHLAPRVGAFATQPWDNGPPCEPSSGY